MGEILASIPRSVTVAAYVRDHEAQAVYAADGFRIVDIETLDEQALFISFAALLGDDGESITGAIAAQRNWAIGTDDRAAITCFRQYCPQLELLSSLELLKHWADSEQIDQAEISQALRYVRMRGRYQPRKNHPLYQWWETHYGL